MEYTLQSLTDQREAIINAFISEKIMNEQRLAILSDCLQTTDSMIREVLECMIPYAPEGDEDINIELEEESDENEHDA